MGGIGSGRSWYWGARATTDEFRGLDVRYLARSGLLEPGRCSVLSWKANGETVGRINLEAKLDRLRLHYRTSSTGGPWKDHDYHVHLNSQQCHLGGERQWFECPARGCNRRIAILYGGEIFACRHCHRLAYPSTREAVHWRGRRKLDKLRERLSWESEVDEWMRKRPKGMHKATFQRLVREFEILDHEANTALSSHILELRQRIGQF